MEDLADLTTPELANIYRLEFRCCIYMHSGLEVLTSLGEAFFLGETYDSCPIVSPLSSFFAWPELVDDSSFNHVSSSDVDMLTRSLNSLLAVSSELWVSKERGVLTRSRCYRL